MSLFARAGLVWLDSLWNNCSHCARKINDRPACALWTLIRCNPTQRRFGGLLAIRHPPGAILCCKMFNTESTESTLWFESPFSHLSHNVRTATEIKTLVFHIEPRSRSRFAWKSQDDEYYTVWELNCSCWTLLSQLHVGFSLRSINCLFIYWRVTTVVLMRDRIMTARTWQWQLLKVSLRDCFFFPSSQNAPNKQVWVEFVAALTRQGKQQLPQAIVRPANTWIHPVNHLFVSQVH